MKIEESKIPYVKEFIAHSFSENLSDSFLKEQADLICRILDSHYFATILFPNKHSDQTYYFSNNPGDFNDVYLPLQSKDVLQDFMMNGKSPVSYNRIADMSDPKHRDFFTPLQQVRPVSDCLYIPFTLTERLCGFTAIARAGINRPEYQREDLQTFDFLSSYLTENFIRSFRQPPPETNQAYLDREGHILSCGELLKDVLIRNTGERFWDTPLTGDRPFSRIFERTFLSVLNNLPDSTGTFPVKTPDKNYRLEFSKTATEEFSYLPVDIPAITIQLKEDFGENDSLLDYDKIVNVYSLTTREREILDCLYKGYSNKTISETLRISLSTVKKHIWNIYNKVGVDSRTSLIYALSV